MWCRTAGFLGLFVACFLPGCAYRWGSGAVDAGVAGPVCINVPLVDNESGVPDLDELLIDAIINVAREYPGIRLSAGKDCLSVTVVVRRAGTDILVKDTLERPVEARRYLVAEVTVANHGAVIINTADLSAGEGLELNRRAGGGLVAKDKAVKALARAILDTVSGEGTH